MLTATQIAVTESMPVFSPPFYLRNPHLQTIFNSMGPKRFRASKLLQRMGGESLHLSTSVGDILLGEYNRAAGKSGTLVVLIHGWEGSSRSGYQITTAYRFLQQGYDVLRLNLRDHGDSHHLNRDIFNSTLTDETASAIGNFLTQHPYEHVYLAGYSLGGSFSLRIAADHGVDLGVERAVAICSPIEPANTMAALNNGWFVYERYFFNKWSRSLRLKLQHFPDFDFAEDLERARSLDDINAFIIPRYTPFAEVDDYFSAYSIAGDRLANLAVSAYLINAVDDPIIPVADISKMDPNPQLTIELQPFGGHCGFIENLKGESWIETRLCELFSQS